MIDTKRIKEVAANFSGTAASTPLATLPDGSTVGLGISGAGVLYVTLTDSDGTVSLSMGTDDAAAPATPVGAFLNGVYRSTLPTYTDGDATIFHFDSRGRLLVSPGEAGITADIEVEDSAGPANPVGSFPMGLYRATLPTYTDGDVACMHFTQGGLLRVSSVSAQPTAGAVTTVAGAAASTTILASNVNRLGATIFNEQPTDGSGETLYLKLDASAASTTSYTVQVPPNDYYEVPFSYTGEIRGIWGSATGNARITELT